MLKSRTRVRYLARVFDATDPLMKKMHVQMLRLCVLYEDWRIEYLGADQDYLPPLDVIDLETRRFYFVRCSLATLLEISGALNVLNAQKPFKKLKDSWAVEAKREWDKAVKFFAAKHEFLRDWRNDVGGHFGDAAATHVAETIDQNLVGSIELFRTANGADGKMAFAYEFVATAMMKNRQAQETPEAFAHRAFSFLRDAHVHARNVVQILTLSYLYDRFK